MKSLIRQIRYVLRSCSRHTGLAAVAIGLLTLGIVVSTAIFGLVDPVFLKPLPVESREQLVEVNSDDTCGELRDFSCPLRADLWLRSSEVPSDSFAVTDGATGMEMANAELSAQPQAVKSRFGSGKSFRVRGSGRTLARATHKASGPAVAVLIYDCGRESALIGKRILKQKSIRWLRLDTNKGTGDL